MDNPESTRTIKKSRDPRDIGRISRDPRVMGGIDVIAGTRIAPSFVWSFHKAGYTTEQIIEQYPHLYPEDVDAAIRFEADKRREGAA